MEMDTLTMQNNTTISGDAKWLVDTLNIHTNGSVQVGNLIANKVEITVPEGDTTAKLTANNLLVAGDPLQMHDAVATSSMLVTDGTGGLPFHFVSGGSTPSGNANVNVTAGNIFVFAGD